MEAKITIMGNKGKGYIIELSLPYEFLDLFDSKQGINIMNKNLGHEWGHRKTFDTSCPLTKFILHNSLQEAEKEVELLKISLQNACRSLKEEKIDKEIIIQLPC